MNVEISLKLKYWIINKETNIPCVRNTVSFSAEDVVSGVSDKLGAPVQCDMENEYYYGLFEIISE